MTLDENPESNLAQSCGLDLSAMSGSLLTTPDPEN